MTFTQPDFLKPTPFRHHFSFTSRLLGIIFLLPPVFSSILYIYFIQIVKVFENDVRDIFFLRNIKLHSENYFPKCVVPPSIGFC